MADRTGIDLPTGSPDAVSALEARLEAEASVLMKRGIALLEAATTEAAVDALACFDQAMVLRRQLPAAHVPRFGYGLAACLLNRADALNRLGEPDRHEAAVQSQDEAIVLLQRLPLGEDPRYRRRLAIAHQNRGLSLSASPGTADDAIQDFAAAERVLDDPDASLIPDRDYLLAAVCVNLATAYRSEAGPANPSHARQAAHKAMALAARLERSDAEMAEVGLKARHALCRTIADQLPPGAADGAAITLVHAATDAVDGGLELAGEWERKGVTRFRDVASDLFRFGSMVYGRYQPQFLAEFIEEHSAIRAGQQRG